MAQVVLQIDSANLHTGFRNPTNKLKLSVDSKGTLNSRTPTLCCWCPGGQGRGHRIFFTTDLFLFIAPTVRWGAQRGRALFVEDGGPQDEKAVVRHRGLVQWKRPPTARGNLSPALFLEEGGPQDDHVVVRPSLRGLFQWQRPPTARRTLSPALFRRRWAPRRSRVVRPGVVPVAAVPHRMSTLFSGPF